MIVLDLEWNSGLYDPIHLDEILQIGAVKLDRKEKRITDSICIYIRPTIHKQFSPGAAVLPDLDQIRASDVDFADALQSFMDWCGDETEFGAWGGDDARALKSHAKYRHLKCPIPDSIVDIQASFGLLLGTSDHIALQRAVEYERIPEVFEYHNALYDALYAAIILADLPEGLLKKVSHKPKAKPQQAMGKYGPFPSLEHALDNRGCRLAVCPKCKEKFHVTMWFQQGRTFLGKCSCPEHGTMFLRLALRKNQAGFLWGTTTQIPPTNETRNMFNTAKKTGKRFPCHHSTGNRRKHRKRIYWNVIRPATDKNGTS